MKNFIYLLFFSLLCVFREDGGEIEGELCCIPDGEQNKDCTGVCIYIYILFSE